jgi:phosphoribosyl 1,2-cyclic phosphate phosphodiesterase
MILTILGSGGAMPVPRPFCQCKICKRARNIGEPYKRNSSSLLINDIETVIDCGEDIADSLNLRGVKQVKNLLITHWHPDHSFGLRPILEANFNFRTNKPDKIIDLYLPKTTYKILKEKFFAIDYFIKIQRTARLHLIEDGDKIEIGDVTITVVGYKGKKSNLYAYLIEHKGMKALYSPCDTLDFNRYKDFPDLDLLITECGLFSSYPTEISFKDSMKKIEKINPKKVILTHLEEVELNIYGEKYLEKMKKKYPNINFDFAYDGMKIKL